MGGKQPFPAAPAAGAKQPMQYSKQAWASRQSLALPAPQRASTAARTVQVRPPWQTFHTVNPSITPGGTNANN
jgi:hypothetical protein